MKTHFSGDTPAIYINSGKGGFRDGTLRSGLGVETRFVTWGVIAADLDNDGNPDIFEVTGGIYPEVKTNTRLPGLCSGTWATDSLKIAGQAGPGVEALQSSRGCAFGDFDNDGDVDIVIVNQNEPPSLLRNDVSGGTIG